MSKPEIAVLLSSYQRPGHLKKSLFSIAMQRGVWGKMELVVTDDGSTDETPEVVERFARSVDFRVTYTTHPHNGFQLSRCRNEGVSASSADYILITDGDCILPPDHVALHLKHRRRKTIMAGGCYRFDEETSSRVTRKTIRSGEYVDWISRRQKRRMAAKAFHAKIYNLLHLKTWPRLSGNNIGIWRRDYERINGFDENYVGWGLEDRDLQERAARLGIRFKSIVAHTTTCHLWHPRDPSYTPKNENTFNLEYFRRAGGLTCSRNGMVKRQLNDLDIRVMGNVPNRFKEGLPPESMTAGAAPSAAEVEVLFLPGEGEFSGKADCNILVVTEDHSGVSKRLPKADLVVADEPYPIKPTAKRFKLDDFRRALKAVA